MLLIRVVGVVIGGGGGRVRYLLLMRHGRGGRCQSPVRLKGLEYLPLGRVIRIELYGRRGRDDRRGRGGGQRLNRGRL